MMWVSQRLPCTEPRRPRAVRDWGNHGANPRELGQFPWRRTLFRTGMSPKSGKAGRRGTGSYFKQEGLWVEGCVAPRGDTTALGREVVSADNAHGDKQRAPAEEALDITGWAQPQGQLSGPAVCSENSSPPVTPISAKQAHKMHTQAGLNRGVPTRLQGVP